MKIDGASYETQIINTQQSSIKNSESGDTQNTAAPVRDGKDKTAAVDEMYKHSNTDRNQLPVSEKFIIDTIEKANKTIIESGRRFEYGIHEKTKQIAIKVINTDTDEVVREIPSEKILNMVAAMMDRAGLFVNEKR